MKIVSENAKDWDLNDVRGVHQRLPVHWQRTSEINTICKSIYKCYWQFTFISKKQRFSAARAVYFRLKTVMLEFSGSNA